MYINVHKCLNNLAAYQLTDLFKTKNDIHQYKTRQSNNVHADKSKEEYYNASFTITGVKLWNSLSQTVKNMPTLSSFMHASKTYFLNLQQCQCYILYVFMILAF